VTNGKSAFAFVVLEPEDNETKLEARVEIEHLSRIENRQLIDFPKDAKDRKDILDRGVSTN